MKTKTKESFSSWFIIILIATVLIIIGATINNSYLYKKFNLYTLGEKMSSPKIAETEIAVSPVNKETHFICKVTILSESGNIKQQFEVENYFYLNYEGNEGDRIHILVCTPKDNPSANFILTIDDREDLFQTVDNESEIDLILGDEEYNQNIYLNCIITTGFYFPL